MVEKLMNDKIKKNVEGGGHGLLEVSSLKILRETARKS
jgi:hypothetical protein